MSEQRLTKSAMNYPCRCCSQKVSTYFAMDNIPFFGHLCDRCYYDQVSIEVRTHYKHRDTLTTRVEVEQCSD
jgi:C4-type Zn-finger protein